jgi:agmatine/peptidylarginine deiminase
MKHLIAEFERQSFTQIIFPHKKSDWVEYLEEAERNFVEIINAVTKYQNCLVVCDDIAKVKAKLQKSKRLLFVEYTSDDTWARDCSALCVKDAHKSKLLDFTFNGWGDKFEATKDNAMNQNIHKCYKNEMHSIAFILEGGAVESNGEGLLLTTSECMLNKNRNKNLSKEQITEQLKESFGATNILYLNHGYLAGDDTDSHIDTLVRFIDTSTLMYVSCRDREDEHYRELKLMEEELKVFAKEYNLTLIALPFSSKVEFEGERLPATYANFLFVNGAVLVPTYGVKEDKEALEIFEKTFSDREIVAIDCQTLIKQHGSLHCVTMNFASGIELTCP